ncbi:MAG: glycosyltransferase [Candidatus Latescibacterota bacterium]
MNILMLTNTYTPFIGGVPRSVESFTVEYRKRGHRVIVIAPEFENMPPVEVDVIRLPAIQHFNGTDFSLHLPVPGEVSEALGGFQPDIVHSHHPYLIGDTAIRLAKKYETPIIFTNHTLYEQYTHYVPGDSPLLKRFVISLSVGYANLCDRVFAPSESIAQLLRERGVESPIDIVPTGIDAGLFCNGDGRRMRHSKGIPKDAFVVGFVSRVAPEKNISFLCEAVAEFMRREETVHFLLVGNGPSEENVEDFFRQKNMLNRFHPAGFLQGPLLADAYRSMDVFAFASKSETQGIVIAEAMAAGVPVVALDAAGVREVVDDGENGFLLSVEDKKTFACSLYRILRMGGDERKRFSRNAMQKASHFSKERCAERALHAYHQTILMGCKPKPGEDNPWEEAKRVIRTEWDLLTNLVHAAGAAISHTEPDQ